MKSFVIIIFLFAGIISFSQENYSKDNVLEFQKEINQDYSDTEKSPLLEENLATFESLDFFEPNQKFFIKAKFIRTPDEKSFKMPSSGKIEQMYVKYAELHFSIDGKDFKLDVFQNIQLSKIPLYKNSLFLPFTDLTSGVSTYGGGRYIDLEIPESDEIYLDFNKAYHPYCAYNPKYSCPIPPEQNDLDIEIKAGVKLGESRK